MDRGFELFERIRASGLSAIDQLIADAEPESLFLEFKRAATARGATSLHDSDRKNFSRALSGFANSEGGVLVWGVDFRSVSGVSGEVGTKVPVEDAAGFRSLLEAAISGEAVPPPSGVLTHHVPGDSAPNGFVAVYIPASLAGPIRSIRSDNYMMRAGSSFKVVPHGLLAGMFGKTLRPLVRPMFISHHARLNERKDGYTLAFGIAAGNFGAVVANRLYFACQHNLPNQFLNVQVRAPEYYSLRRDRLPAFSIVAKDGVTLVPGGVDDLCDIVVSLPAKSNPGIRFNVSLGAEGAEPLRFFMDFSQETLRDLHERLAGSSMILTSTLWTSDAPETHF